MSLSQELENMVLKINDLTNMDVAVTDDKKIVYYIGDVDKCATYLDMEISKELKELSKEPFNEAKIYHEEEALRLIDDEDEDVVAQVIYSVYKDGKFDKFFIFSKPYEELDESDMTIIKSSMYLIKKYFN